MQGIIGSTPSNAMVFITLYLQLLGMSDFSASLLMALMLAGGAIGGLLGGAVGDAAARRFPNHGRIAVTQFSVSLGVPLSFLILRVGPAGGCAAGCRGYALPWQRSLLTEVARGGPWCHQRQAQLLLHAGQLCWLALLIHPS
jgi:hypothetical protein